MACQTAAMKELVGALTENHLPATPDPASALQRLVLAGGTGEALSDSGGAISGRVRAGDAGRAGQRGCVADDRPPVSGVAGARPSGPTAEAKHRAADASRHEFLRLLATGQSMLDKNDELCVLQGRLYLASLAGLPVPTAKTYFITLKKMRYVPFCADFGPFNLGR